MVEYNDMGREQAPKVEWREYPRKSEVLFVGDLNGSFFAFLSNTLQLDCVRLKEKSSGSVFEGGLAHQVIDSEAFKQDHAPTIRDFLKHFEIEWKGGSKKLVFLGDILGDRRGQGDVIYEVVDRLSEQAEQAGGSISLLAGNHDIAALRALAYLNPMEARIIESQCPLEEYERFMDIEDDIRFAPDMYEDPDFVDHIETVKDHIRLVELIDDTLFIHRDVNPIHFINFWKFLDSHCEKLITGYHELSKPERAKKMVPQLNAELRILLDEVFEKKGDKILVPDDKKRAMFDKWSGIDSENPRGKESAIFGVFCGYVALRSVKVDKSDPDAVAEYDSEILKRFLNEWGISAYVYGHSSYNKTKVFDDGTSFVSSDGRSSRSGRRQPINYSYGRIGVDGGLMQAKGQDVTEVRSV